MTHARFGYALLAGAALLASAGAQAACNLALTAALPLKIENGRLFVPGTIGDHPVEFMLDPGAPTVLLQAAGRDFGITPDNYRSLPLKAVMGDMEKQVALGPNADHDVIMSVDHLPIRLVGSLPNFGSPTAVATLGIDFLAYFDVEIDAAHQTLNLFRPDGCKDAKLAYWTKHYVAADMVANITRPLNVEPFTVYNFPHINIRMSVNGHDMVAALNPGDKDSSLSLTAAHEVGVDSDGAPEADAVPDVFDGYSTRAWMGSFDKLAFGPETIAPAKVKIRSFNAPAGASAPRTGSITNRQRDVGDDMVLGADFLISHRVLISYSQNKVYFSPAEGQSFLGTAPVLPADVSSR